MSVNVLKQNKAFPDKKERLNIFDNLKFLLIIFVVIGHIILEYTDKDYGLHSAQGMFVFIYAFHMPLFLLVSGLFQSRKNDRLPYDKIIIYFTLGYLLKMLLSISNAIFTDSKLNFSLIDGDGVFWYLFAMAGFTLICYGVRKLPPLIVYLVSIPLALLVGYDSSVGDVFVLSRVIVLFPFFYTGFVIEPQKLADFARKLPVKIFSWAVILLWLYLSFFHTEFFYKFRQLMTARNSYKDVPHIENCGWLDRGFVMIIAAILCVAFIGISTNTKIPFVTRGGQNTLAVYFWHKPVLIILLSSGVAQGLQKAVPSVWIIMLAVVGIAVAAVLAIPLFSKPFDKFIKVVKKSYGKTKIKE